MRRHLLLASLLILPGTICLAQDTARMEQVVQSFASNGSFAGSILVVGGGRVLFERRYDAVPPPAGGGLADQAVHRRGDPAARGARPPALDDPVKTHLPGAPASWDGMTVGHMRADRAVVCRESPPRIGRCDGRRG
jgi:hypothetical protein